jgi:4-hydroxy-2-oxoheptanedioate aldolase
VNGGALKQALAGGATCVGAILKIPSPDVVEVLCGSGLDFVIVDAEHGPSGPETCQQMVRAGEAKGVPVFVRIGEAGSPATVTRFLDTGVSGVHLPHMSSAATAREQAAQLLHPPGGGRGLAGGRWADYGAKGPLPGQVEAVANSICVVAQIEEVEAYEALDEILAVEELDVFFLGSTDLAASLGFRGDRDVPRVKEMSEAILKRTVAAGRTAGFLASTPEEAAWGLGLGARYIVFNGESLIQWGAKRGLEAVAAQ